MSLFGKQEQQENTRLRQELDRQTQMIAHLQSQLLPEHNQINTLNNQIEELNRQAHKLYEYSQNATKQLAQLDSIIAQKKATIIQLDDEILFQEFALYQPIYDFARSEQYKTRLDEIRAKQKDMVKTKTAVSYSDNWTVDGSKQKGAKMTNNNIKQILRTFNTECENAIDRVKFNNVESMKKRIVSSFEALNKMNETNHVSLKAEYAQLKLDELNLAIEYALKKQDEKEEEKRFRAEQREAQKLQKEIEEARKTIEKEKKHYLNAQKALEAQLENATEEQKLDLLAKQEEILSKIEELNEASAQVDYREANQKAGYVYIISNIGSFGENVYKIGMTRRLDPMDRIVELGDASVPFVFDVHALIFSEDAPKLESALHQAFDNHKLNCINKRKEFFRCSLEDIKAVVRSNFDKTVEFVDLPEASDYRQSLKMNTI